METSNENNDPMVEIEAMRTVAAALSSLGDATAVKRVLSWAISRFQVSKQVSTESVNLNTEAVFTEAKTDQYQDLAEFYSAASPSSESEKALVVAYWFQIKQGQPDFDAQGVNTQLKQLGHGVSNITTALGGLMTRRPQLVIQTRKDGTSRQARKKYKVTAEGIKAVSQLLAGQKDGEDR